LLKNVSELGCLKSAQAFFQTSDLATIFLEVPLRNKNVFVANHDIELPVVDKSAINEGKKCRIDFDDYSGLEYD